MLGSVYTRRAERVITRSAGLLYTRPNYISGQDDVLTRTEEQSQQYISLDEIFIIIIIIIIIGFLLGGSRKSCHALHPPMYFYKTGIICKLEATAK
jgi:hypothetical protein